MGKIEWTDASWNPIVGCSETSPGCANCYAARLAASRLRGMQAYNGLTTIQTEQNGHAIVKGRPVHWNGEVRFLPERLEEPLHWRKPRRIFVCDMGDLFHEAVDDLWIDRILGSLACWHTYQILTKRAERMHRYFTTPGRHEKVMEWMLTGGRSKCTATKSVESLKNKIPWPLANVWFGVSVENQHFAVERIPFLMATPATVRWISAEPLLGELRIQPYLHHPPIAGEGERAPAYLDWVVCGGESGPSHAGACGSTGARPMHPDWARSLRDQCQAAGVPFFFKQWGEWFPNGQARDPVKGRYEMWHVDGLWFEKLGKKKSGRLLDGREWNEFPKQDGAAHVPGKGSVGESDG
jgi:protein gp37